MTINPNAAQRAKSRGWKFWTILSIALISCLACLLLFFVVVFHDYYLGVGTYESYAVAKLHKINALEHQYAAGHAHEGFACELSLLPLTAQMGGGTGTGTVLMDGGNRGYRFKIVGCAAEPSGIVTRYQVVAIPIRPGRTGVRAFCTDQAGEVFYDPDADAAKCLASRNVLP